MSHVGWAVTFVLTAPRMGKISGGVKGPGAKVAPQLRGSQLFLFICPSEHGLSLSLLPQITER